MEQLKLELNTDFIRERREALGYSQEKVSQRVKEIGANMTSGHLSKYETGFYSKDTPMTMQTLLGLAYALKCRVSEIYTATPAPLKFPLTPAQAKKERNKIVSLNKIALGKKLKDFRIKRNQSVDVLGGKIGKHPQYCFIIENGGAGSEIMVKYAQALGYPLSEKEKEGLK